MRSLYTQSFYFLYITMNTSIALFEQKEVRKVWDSLREQRFFSIVDVVTILTESIDGRKYWNKLKQRLKEEWSELVTNCHQLKLLASDGKYYKTDCANTEWILRTIQSIPSPKAEPFKQRLAKVGYERIQEIDDPELAMYRMRSIYEKKWYPKNWIEKRERGIAVRNSLTDERKERWIKKGIEYAILTDEIYQATFGMTAKEYKEYKWIEKENLRDHMNDLELIFTMLGEASTTEIMDVHNTQWFDEAQQASRDWGKVAEIARKDLESKTGKRITNKKNHLWWSVRLKDMM